MDTKIYQADELSEAVAAIKAGQLVAFPTETVYGLGADAQNEAAVKQVYAAKGRPSDNPLIVHVSSFEQVKAFVDNFPVITEKLVETFWPGPLTLIFPIKPGTLPAVVTGGLSTAAFRMPNNKKTLALIAQSGRPIVGPSANTSGKPSPTTAEHVYHDLKGKIAGVLDDGSTEIGVESTVLDLSQAVPMILRPGAITEEALAAVIGPVAIDGHLVSAEEVPKAPGMKYRHYAPQVPVQIVEGADWQAALAWAAARQQRPGILADQAVIAAFPAVPHFELTTDNDVATAAQRLFAGLRYFDEQPIDVLFVQGFAEQGMGVAYMNRLKKAASGNFFTSGT
ncbi:Sua5/YciO/YrdC/YwlC family protein [Enterococcus canis]|uniref:Threonylcarbamoyl-AMP synthase n=1 Tax=Enterococcus canis TaxID=214095 RepID=A0A1L8RDD6_9ENTE|nr:L-threonylcarbamoyladenylate synthase [Enterococcus canis]OJG17702.1 Sua5/YciO/YrdC/YwlC family protein [Enterococcus canis]